MTGLSHEQAKRYIQTASGNGLNPMERASLEAHLTNCSACRAYQTEMSKLDTAITRALRTRWATPRRSPIDMSARVRMRMSRDVERRFFLTLAQTFVKLSSLAVVVVVGVSLLQNHNLQPGAATPAESYKVVSNVRNGLPAFEFETDESSAKLPLVDKADTDVWPMPAFIPLGSQVMYY